MGPILLCLFLHLHCASTAGNKADVDAYEAFFYLKQWPDGSSYKKKKKLSTASVVFRRQKERDEKSLAHVVRTSKRSVSHKGTC